MTAGVIIQLYSMIQVLTMNSLLGLFCLIEVRLNLGLGNILYSVTCHRCP